MGAGQPAARKQAAMTVDERIEKLVERHEALAISVEHLAISVEQLISEGRKSELLIGRMAEGISSLVNVLKVHEKRISQLEG
jgi:hypothetical protein